jgi:hypothetical protein
VVGSWVGVICYDVPMVTNNPTDNDYAKACQEILNSTARLSAAEIDKKFGEVGHLYFPNFDSEPENLMLKEVYGSVIFDELDPTYPGADHVETLERIRTIIGDYLSRNFYPTYFSLSGSYGDKSQGYTWVTTISEGYFIIKSGNDEVRNTLSDIAANIQLTGNDEADLSILKTELPLHINNLTLTSSEVSEYLV